MGCMHLAGPRVDGAWAACTLQVQGWTVHGLHAAWQPRWADGGGHGMDLVLGDVGSWLCGNMGGPMCLPVGLKVQAAGRCGWVSFLACWSKCVGVCGLVGFLACSPECAGVRARAQQVR